jgi:hypothetical protein
MFDTGTAQPLVAASCCGGQLLRRPAVLSRRKVLLSLMRREQRPQQHRAVRWGLYPTLWPACSEDTYSRLSGLADFGCPLAYQSQSADSDPTFPESGMRCHGS